MSGLPLDPVRRHGDGPAVPRTRARGGGAVEIHPREEEPDLHGSNPGVRSGELDDRGAGRTAREIAQQPALWREVAKTVSALGGKRDAFLRPLLDRRDVRIVLAGAGTSAYAGELLAPALARRLGRRVEAVASTELVADPHGCFAEDVPTLLVSFSRSGDSPEAVAATRLADRLLTECHHLVVTCNPDGLLHQEHAAAESSMVLRMPPRPTTRASP